MEVAKFTQKVDKYTPIYYGGASGDFNPIHIDNDFAKMVGLGGVILQGLCTMAYAQRLAVDSTEGQDPGKLKKLSVRFTTPVKPGNKIEFDGEVSDGKDGKKVISISARNQDGVDVLSNAFAEVEE